MVNPLGHCRLDVTNSVRASPSRYERSILGVFPQSVQYMYLYHNIINLHYDSESKIYQ